MRRSRDFRRRERERSDRVAERSANPSARQPTDRTTEEEQTRMTAIDVPDERLTLGHFLDDVVARYDDRPALHFDGVDIAYRELRAESQRLAKGIVEPSGSFVSLRK